MALVVLRPGAAPVPIAALRMEPVRYVPLQRRQAPARTAPEMRVVRQGPLPAPPPVRAPVPVVVLRQPPPVEPAVPEMRVVRYVPFPDPKLGPSGVAATTVGILGSPSTIVTMTPADLMNGYRADITNFTIILDAGVY